MTDLDTNIRSAVRELIDAAPPPPPLPSVALTRSRPPRRRPALVALAVGVALVVLVTGAIVVTNDSDDEGKVVTGALPPATRLDCNKVVGSQRALNAGRTAVLGAVGLTTGRALQVGSSGAADPTARWFAKDGLLVSGRSFELVVPNAWRNRLSFSWGDGNTPRTQRLRVVGCKPVPPQERWLAFVGGYFVPKPACVPVIVKTARASRRVHIGVGAPCRGQAPPPPAPS
jgi:hypothetical protein